MNAPRYYEIVRHYEACLAAHGDSYQGVNWASAADALTRQQVMLGVVRPGTEPVTLLDFGCGTAHLYETLLQAGDSRIDYAGLDISPEFVKVCREKFPSRTFYQTDLLKGELDLPEFDYLVLNGVFTSKQGLSYDEMMEYMQKLLTLAFAKTRRGLAFNVMSKHVDWEKDDLFHVPFDELARFIKQHLSRHFLFRQDYGLYDYTTYIYR